MKKIFVTAISTLILGLTLQAADVNEKVLKSFKETFPKAEQVNWQEFTDNYVVNFTTSGIRERITYDKDGNFLNSTRYYQQENLPANIMVKLQKRYPKQKVYGVTEITTDSNVEYYIKLQDDANWTTVKSDGTGILEVVEKYKRAAEN